VASRCVWRNLGALALCLALDRRAGEDWGPGSLMLSWAGLPEARKTRAPEGLWWLGGGALPAERRARVRPDGTWLVELAFTAQTEEQDGDFVQAVPPKGSRNHQPLDQALRFVGL
jgi:hypothetical protein